jgi:hypothetical protein
LLFIHVKFIRKGQFSEGHVEKQCVMWSLFPAARLNSLIIYIIYHSICGNHGHMSTHVSPFILTHCFSTWPSENCPLRVERCTLHPQNTHLHPVPMATSVFNCLPTACGLPLRMAFTQSNLNQICSQTRHKRHLYITNHCL